MERMVLEAQTRSSMSKGQRKQLRGEGKVPAVIYGRGEDTLPLTVDGRILRQGLITGGSNVIVDLAVKDKGKKNRQETVMFKDVQRDIIYQDRIIHVDFIRISMTDKIEVAVTLNFIGEAAGLIEGGVFSMVTREVAIKCLPGDIPEHFDVDISALKIGDSLAADALDIDQKFEVLTPPDTLLAQILAPMAEEKPEVGEGEETAAEVTVAAAETSEAEAAGEE
ncbi:MAG: 50S ribosomal protein L25 [Firmicutes bacterium]|nr:50S ribosomal protein L25 [Bacillota bacterium]